MAESKKETGKAPRKKSRRKGKNTVSIYPDWCKGCGLCVAFCPGKVLELNQAGKAEAVRQDDCVNCGFCELHCPDFAIVVNSTEPYPTPDSEQDAKA